MARAVQTRIQKNEDINFVLDLIQKGELFYFKNIDTDYEDNFQIQIIPAQKNYRVKYRKARKHRVISFEKYTEKFCK